jgi:LPS sulfotransferase NodH
MCADRSERRRRRQNIGQAPPPALTYLILATPRSGSTLLGQGLQATGLAGDPKEFFGHKMAFWMERWQTPTLSAYANRLIQSRATPNGVFGAKLLYGQLQNLEDIARSNPTLAGLPLPEVLDRLFPNLHYLWATRDDKLRQAISWYKARQSGVWGQAEGKDDLKLGRAWRLGDEPLQPGELAFDYDGIAELLAQADREDAAIAAFCASAGVTPYRVVYEEFSPNFRDKTLDILHWMGIDSPPDLDLAKPRTVRLADDRTDEWVARFQQMRAKGDAPVRT